MTATSLSLAERAKLTHAELEGLGKAELLALLDAPLSGPSRLAVALALNRLGEVEPAAAALRAHPLTEYAERHWPRIGRILLRAGPAPDADALLDWHWNRIDPSAVTPAEALELEKWIGLSGLPPAIRTLRSLALSKQRQQEAGMGLRARPPKLRVTQADLLRMDRATLGALTAVALPAKERLRIARFLRSLKHFRTARNLVRALPLEQYPRQAWPDIGTLLADTEQAADIDRLLPDFVATLEQETPDLRGVSRTLSWVSRSSLDAGQRLHLLKRLGRIIPSGDGDPDAWPVAVRLAEFNLRRQANELVDVLDYVPAGPLAPQLARLYSRYIPYLRTEGHETRAFELAQAMRDPDQPDDDAVVLQMMRSFPILVDLNQVVVPEAPRQRRQLLNALSPLRGLSPDHAALLDRVLSFVAEDFAAADVVEQAAILRALLSGDHIEAAQGVVAAAGPVSDLLLPARILDGWHWFGAADYPRAHAAFLSVLEEDPADGTAMAGFRLTAVRTGAGFGAAVVLRATAETAALRPPLALSERTWDLRVNGDLAQASMLQYEAPVWTLLRNLVGERFLTDQDLAELNPDGHAFIIADGGVGDEIRFARLYSRIAGRFRKVSATCDPRLAGLLSRSFPKIEFIPCWRNRSGLTDRLDKMDGRKRGWNGLFYNLLTEEAGARLQTADHIATLGYLQYLDSQAPWREAILGRGFLFPPSGPRPAGAALAASRPASAPLRVGLLWRSHLLVKVRKHMYLPIEGWDELMGIAGVEFHAIQHDLQPEERTFCDARGIVVRDDVDLFNDFEGMSEYLATLDLVIGISSVPAELAAALGVPVWFLGFSPENYFLRTVGGRTDIDQLTLNARVIAAPDIDFTEPVGLCVGRTMREVRRRLMKRVAARTGSRR